MGTPEQHRERLEALRDRAYRILEYSRHDDSVPDDRVQQLELGLRMIETGAETIENHPRPQDTVPYDLEARLDQWEAQFDQREQELGIPQEDHDA